MLDSIDKFDNDKVLILRDHLALERTKLANVRTLFAFIRTSLYLLTAGIGILEIKSISHLDGLAWVCILSGIILFVLGIIRYWQIRNHLKHYEEKPQDKKEVNEN